MLGLEVEVFKMIDVGLLWREIVDEVLAHHVVGVAGVVVSSLQGYRLKSSTSSQMDWYWNSKLSKRLEGGGAFVIVMCRLMCHKLKHVIMIEIICKEKLK